MTDQEFKFDYRKYQPLGISLAQLDKQMAFIQDSGTGWIGAIVAGLKIIVFFTYMWARKSLIDNEMELAKQAYEQSRVNTHRDELAGDNLDAQPKIPVAPKK